MVRLAREAVERSWSVRQTESAARSGANGTAKKHADKPKSANVRDLEKRLSSALGTSVTIREKQAGRAGVVEIEYASLDQLDTIVDRVLGD
jgi:ParB family chromosome partitioning protein